VPFFLQVTQNFNTFTGDAISVGFGDPHRFHLDPDPAFPVDADPDQILPIMLQNLTFS
jgi:hypothetical protein